MGTQRGTVVEVWVDWMRASATPQTTIALRVYYLLRLLDDSSTGLLDLGVDDLARWLGSHAWSPNTRKSARSALRCFYGWALVTGRLRTSPAHLLPPVRIPRGRPKPTPERDYRRALDTTDPRARLAVQLAGQCGLRRGEVATARVEDVEEDLVGYSLRVTGKGGHVRVVPLPDPVARALLERGTGWLFPSPRGGHLTPHHVAKIVKATLPDGVSMHSLRHRCATVAYAGTRDLRAVQELLGHSRPETTAGYVLVPDDAVRAAMSVAAA
jgi:integrase/recombinase XerC